MIASERVAIAPLLCAHHVIGHILLQEFGFRAALHRPGVPLPVQLLQIHQAGWPDFDAAELCLGHPCAGMIRTAQ